MVALASTTLLKINHDTALQLCLLHLLEHLSPDSVSHLAPCTI